MAELAPGSSCHRPEPLVLGGGRRLPLGQRTLVMGILNVTPDSFFVASRAPTREQAVERALEMVEEGADIIDVGGESTRPGSDPVSLAAEIERVLPVVEGVRKASGVAISVDTRKAEVARLALAAGADIVNDVSGLTADPEMAAVVAASGAVAIVMHMRGTPGTMQEQAQYDDVVLQVKAELGARIAALSRAGIAQGRMWIDPGLGFAKLARHNLEILNRLDELAVFEKPVVLGASRKSFLGRLLGGGPASPDLRERFEPSLAVAAIAVLKGAHVLRVHDVAATRRLALVADAVVDPSRAEGL